MAAKRLKDGETDISRAHQNSVSAEVIRLKDIDSRQSVGARKGDKEGFTPKDGYVQPRNHHAARQYCDIQTLVRDGLEMLFGPPFDHFDQDVRVRAMKAVDQMVKGLAQKREGQADPQLSNLP